MESLQLNLRSLYKVYQTQQLSHDHTYVRTSAPYAFFLLSHTIDIQLRTYLFNYLYA